MTAEHARLAVACGSAASRGAVLALRSDALARRRVGAVVGREYRRGAERRAVL